MTRDLVTIAAFALLAAMSVGVAACSDDEPSKPPAQLTLKNYAGEMVVCRMPDNPAFREIGRIATVAWCANACRQHGYHLIDEDRPNYIHFMINDLDLGKKERPEAEKYIPKQCLPYNPGPMGIITARDGGVVACMGILFKSGKCPD